MSLRRSALPWRTLGVAAAVLAAAAAPSLFPLMHYTRSGILGGELWRLLTGQMVHANRYHLLWDVLPLIAVGLLFEGSLGRRYWSVLGVSALAVGVGLLLLDPGLPAYCGLSGALNGLWIGGALLAARQEMAGGSRGLAAIYRLAVAADLGKIAVELAWGAPLFTDAGALGVAPVPLAHALGALGGVIGAGIPAPRGSVGRPLDPVHLAG